MNNFRENTNKKPPKVDCDHQYKDSYEARFTGSGSEFNFCPWCGADLRKEKSNDSIQRTNGRNS